MWRNRFSGLLGGAHATKNRRNADAVVIKGPGTVARR